MIYKKTGFQWLRLAFSPVSILCYYPTYYIQKIGYFWMSNAYFAVATDSKFDPVFQACDEATVKTTDQSTFWTIAPSSAFCQKCKQHRLKALDE